MGCLPRAWTKSWSNCRLINYILMKCCTFVSHHATFWHCYKGEEGARTATIKQCLNNYDSHSHGLCQSPLSLAGPSSQLPLVRVLQAKKKNKHKKRYTWGTALSGMKILADFDELISEQTGNTRLMCLIIITVAYLQRRILVETIGWTESLSYTCLCLMLQHSTV